MRTDEMLMVQNIHDELMDDIERLRTTLLRSYQFISPHSDPMGSNVQMASEIMAALSIRPAQDKADALQDSAYIAGMQEGFRLGLDENHEGLAKRITARDGYLASITRPAPAAEVAGEREIVTEEMIRAGSEAIDDYYNGTKDAPFEGSVRACYLAMRVKLSQLTGRDHGAWPVEDRVIWGTCGACGGTGSTEKAYPFPDDPEFCEEHRCEECGGSGRKCR